MPDEPGLGPPHSLEIVNPLKLNPLRHSPSHLRINWLRQEKRPISAPGKKTRECCARRPKPPPPLNRPPCNDLQSHGCQGEDGERSNKHKAVMRHHVQARK